MKSCLYALFIVISASCGKLEKQNETEHYIIEKENGSTIMLIDVCTRLEWKTDGHASCSVNFPPDELPKE